MDNCFFLDEPIVLVKQINKYKYQLTDLIPDVSISYQIWCYNSNDVFIKALSGIIEGEEYSNWGEDDNYIENIIRLRVVNS